MTQNRVSYGLLVWPCRQLLAGPASRAGPLTCGQAPRSGGCSAPLRSRLSVPRQLFYQIATWHSACPLPWFATTRPWLPGPQGAHAPPGLPWLAVDEHSVLPGFPRILRVVVITPGNWVLAVPLVSEGPPQPCLSSLLPLPTLVFSLLQSPSQPVLDLLSRLSQLFFLLPPSLSTRPLFAFSRQTPNGKHLFPGAL